MSNHWAFVNTFCKNCIKFMPFLCAIVVLLKSAVLIWKYFLRALSAKSISPPYNYFFLRSTKRIFNDTINKALELFRDEFLHYSRFPSQM